MTTSPAGGSNVPEDLLLLSAAALDLHDPTLPVAVLVADTLLDRNLPVPPGATRRLCFERDTICVDVTLLNRAASSQLHIDALHAAADGLLEPAEYDVVELVQPPARRTLRLTHGAATFTGVPAGLTSLVLRGRSGAVPTAAARTAWFTI